MTACIDDTAQRERVRQLNDQLRQAGIGGKLVCTAGVAALPEAMRAKMMMALRAFDQFTPDNDPYQEHDFGPYDVDGAKLFFKVDYYDRAMACHSPDPADPAVTTRVMTIMLAEEY